MSSGLEHIAMHVGRHLSQKYGRQLAAAVGGAAVTAGTAIAPFVLPVVLVGGAGFLAYKAVTEMQEEAKRRAK